MKKLLVLVLGLFLALGLVGCGVLENADKDYYVTGNFNGWDTKEDAIMEAISRNDSRVASIKGDLKGVKFLYILEVTLPEEAAGWSFSFTIDGEEVEFDGNLTVKVIRTAAGDPDTRDFWAQNRESGKIDNLTPSTLYMPTYAETVEDGSGTWADNPAAFEAGTYYVVFAEFDGSRAMGLIAK